MVFQGETFILSQDPEHWASGGFLMKDYENLALHVCLDCGSSSSLIVLYYYLLASNHNPYFRKYKPEEGRGTK